MIRLIVKVARMNSQQNPTQGQFHSVLPLEDCQWFEESGFNLATKNVKDWPVRFTIDLLEYVGQVWTML